MATIASVVALVAAVAVVAVGWPVWRAAHIDPATVLRAAQDNHQATN